MITPAARRLARRALLERALRRALPYDGWHKSALVFAPHQDDETLGCGGTIAKKRRNASRVHVAFMTDGSGSHADRIPREELRAVRRTEAEQACRVLGLSSDELTFLNIEDGSLARCSARARAETIELMERFRPEEVFVPYRADDQPDHVATNRIVYEAIGETGAPVRVYEYPVWFWHQFPWVGLPDSPRRAVAMLRTAGPSGRALYREFLHAADVRDALAVKRAALQCHRSQMERRDGDAGWPILADVSNGEWLECFFSGHELFRCSDRANGEA